MEKKKIRVKEASFYRKFENGTVRCELCPHVCMLKDGERGKCRVRKNIKGELFSLSYERPVAVHLDPIEKKPLYHFLPGTHSLSVGMAGCNLRCKQCQNWEISQQGPEAFNIRQIEARKIVDAAVENDSPSVSYTYTEPIVSFEYLREIANIAKSKNIKNIIVSNGFINEEPLRELCKFINAANIDLKSISEDFYNKICEGRIEPVLNTLKILKEDGVWLEITNLLISKMNDSDKNIKDLVLWIKENLGSDTVLHFSAFYPNYELKDLKPTPPETVIKARKIAIRLGMKYVYTGNIDDVEGSTTYCPKCNEAVIKRKGYKILFNKLSGGKCPCGQEIPGVWQ